MAEPGVELRWTADAQSASEAAAIAWRMGFSRVLTTAACFGALMVLNFTWSAQRSGATDPLSYGVPRGVLSMFAVFAALGLCTFFGSLRTVKRRLYPGSELAARWEEDSVVFVTDLAEIRIRLATVKAVRPFAFWVALQQEGTRMWMIWPRELFPEDQLARLPVVSRSPATHQ